MVEIHQLCYKHLNVTHCFQMTAGFLSYSISQCSQISGGGGGTGGGLNIIDNIKENKLSFI